MRAACVMLAFLLGSVPASPADPKDEYCAFEVEVKTATGLPSSGVRVVGQDDAGFQFGTAITDQQGVARLCNSPRGLAEITVGGRMCGAVSVKYLNPLWPRTRHVVVTYQRCVGNDYYFPGRCEVTLRLMDEYKAPISDVTLRVDAGDALVQEKMLVSDRYGRIFLPIKYGDQLEGTLSKPGYLALRFSEPCKPGDGSLLDRTVTLEALPTTR